MSQSLCLWCGALKVGAFNECPSCGEDAPDWSAALAFTTHHLREDELTQLGRVVRLLGTLGLDEETRFYAFTWFVARKWPKVLSFDMEALDPDVAELVESIYRTHLAELPGQQEETLTVPPWTLSAWERACDAAMQGDDDRWKADAPRVLLEGMAVAEQIVQVMVAGGEGALLQRAAGVVRRLLKGVHYGALVGDAERLCDAAKEYARLVGRFRRPVKNGWSGRTKRQAEYLGGTHVRLVQMAEECLKMMRHKAGVDPLIPMDLQRAREEFDQAYRTFVSLGEVVLNPERIAFTGPSEE